MIWQYEDRLDACIRHVKRGNEHNKTKKKKMALKPWWGALIYRVK